MICLISKITPTTEPFFVSHSSYSAYVNLVTRQLQKCRYNQSVQIAEGRRLHYHTKPIAEASCCVVQCSAVQCTDMLE